MRSFRFLMTLCAVGVALLIIGFALFVNEVDRGRPDDRITADGIVVLTGGKSRIDEAIRLLSLHRAQRLLITGVNPKTTRAELAELTPESDQLFNCCIDIDHRARDTIGNATETRHWTRKRNFESLIVVTSSYHMPRTLMELENAMPNVRLIAYSVVPENYRAENWWTERETFQLLLTEYLKFIPAMARIGATKIVSVFTSSGATARSMTIPSRSS